MKYLSSIDHAIEMFYNYFTILLKQKAISGKSDTSAALLTALTANPKNGLCNLSIAYQGQSVSCPISCIASNWLSAVQALYNMESCYGLYPTVVDGQIHFVFCDSVSMETSSDDYDLTNSNAGALLQFQLRGFLHTCALHQKGKLTNKEYALWKNKSPAYLEDFYKIYKQHQQEKADILPEEKPQEPKHKRKINNRH